MTKPLLLATTNAGKIAELQALLQPMSLEVVGLTKAASLVGSRAPQVEETGKTFQDNAVLKAKAYAAWSGMPTLADDSGLCVEALNGAPGVISARYSGIEGDHAANNTKLLNELSTKPAPWSAYFICVIAYVHGGFCSPGGIVWTAEGRVDGMIQPPKGAGGFGYDPLFVPEGHTQSFGELPSEIKNSMSHRGRAIQQFIAMLQKSRATA